MQVDLAALCVGWEKKHKMLMLLLEKGQWLRARVMGTIAVLVTEQTQFHVLPSTLLLLLSAKQEICECNFKVFNLKNRKN